MINDQELVAEEEEAEAEEQLEQLEAKREVDVEEEEQPLAEVSYFDAIVALQQIMEGQDVDVARVAGLNDAERGALDFFRQVVSGRTSGNEFIYAERRLEALNHVLAVLQPILSVGGAHDVLHASLQEVVEGIDALRTRLTGLEDAEEEVFHVGEEQATGAADQDDDEKPKPDAKPDAKAEAKAAAAKAAADKAALDDELDLERRVRKPSTLTDGPAVSAPADQPKKSTAFDPAAKELPAEPKKSTVFDPAAKELPAVPKPPSVWEPDDRGGGKR